MVFRECVIFNSSLTRKKAIALMRKTTAITVKIPLHSKRLEKKKHNEGDAEYTDGSSRVMNRNRFAPVLLSKIFGDKRED